MDRRAFLRFGTYALGGAALAACSRHKGHTFDVFPGGEDFVAGIDNYVAFGIPKLSADKVDVLFAEGARGDGGTFDASAFARETFTGDTERAFYTGTARFPRPGIWQARVTGGGASGTAFITVRARDASGPPVPGDRAIAVDTPTVRDDAGVSPICTRAPACPFHEISLRAALRTRKPVVYFVGSPKFCRSRTCGPNLDELIGGRAPLGPDVQIVHAEVHPNDEADTIRRFRTTEAFSAWRLKSEPWLFVIDRGGRVASRFEGPVTAARMRAAVDEVT